MDRHAGLGIVAVLTVGLAGCTGGSSTGAAGTGIFLGTTGDATMGSGTNGEGGTDTSGGSTGGTASDPCAAGIGVFDETVLHELEVTLAESDWQAMQVEQQGSPEYGGPPKTYFSAQLTFDGEVLGAQVGFRLKGHYSLITALGHAYPLKIDFNRIDPGQKYQSLGKLNLHPAGEEVEGALNEFLSYGSVRDYGIATARTAFALLTVNGEELGVYNLVEQIDGRFIKCHYPEPWGNLYKPEEGNGDLHYAGPDFADYPTVEHKWPDVADHTAFLNMVTVINTGVLSMFPSVLDMTGVMNYFAANTGTGSPDTYASTGHNYYLYEVTPGRFTMIPWDQNISQSEETGPCGAAGRNTQEFPLSYYPLGDVGYTGEYAETLLDFLASEGSEQAVTARLDVAVEVLGEYLPAWVWQERVDSTAVRVDGLVATVPGLSTCP